jgi:hypothetical protein
MESSRPSSGLSGFKAAQAACVLLHFVFFDAFSKDEQEASRCCLADQLCPSFHHPNQQLPFTEVSVSADLLSHFDLIVASAGT